MILRKPDFYDKFKCTASRCSDTCCVGWEIDIDKDSLDAYRKVAGVFGDKLRANIEDGHFKLLPHDRCPFLDKENLCEIYTHLGEDALCGDMMERGIGLCCEEAARLLFAGDGPLQFVTCECDEPEDELDEDDIEVRDQVLYMRDDFFNTLADSDMKFGNKLYNVFGYTGENPFAPFESVEDFVDQLAKTISYGPAWDAALARIQNRIKAPSSPQERVTRIEDEGCFSENDSVRLLAYLIYRHYAKSLYDGLEQGKLQFALFFWNVARFFTKELAGDAPGDIKVNAVKILSKQLEYCEENMAMIETALDE